MVFFRVSLAAALVSNVVTASGLEGDIVNWIAVIAKTGLYVAFVELGLEELQGTGNNEKESSEVLKQKNDIEAEESMVQH